MADRKRTPLKIIVLAAGKGTRMKSATAKVLHQIMGRPMLAYVLDTAEELKTQGIYVVVGYQGAKVQEALADRAVRFIWQREQLGTGHAVLCVESELSGYQGNVVILCGDVPLLKARTVKRLIERHIEQGATLSILTAVVDDPSLYGRVIKDADGNILRIVEDKDAAPEERLVHEINTGIYCAQFPVLLKALKIVKRDNVQGEYYLTDAVQLIREMGYKVISVTTDRQTEVMGINSRDDLARAAEIVRREIGKFGISGRGRA